MSKNFVNRMKPWLRVIDPSTETLLKFINLSLSCKKDRRLLQSPKPSFV